MASQWHMVSIGIVAADKKLKSKFINVFPIELLPFHEGEITDDHINIERKGVDADGKPYNITLQRGMVIKAEWKNESNRIDAPNVMKGEQVELWTAGDSNKYYWVAMGRDDHLRRGESVTWAVNASDSSQVGDIELKDDNTYSFTVDSINKHITVRTSKDNGEPTVYTLQMDCKNGHFTINDDLGNIIQLDSVESSITLANKDNTQVTLNKKTIKIIAEDLIKLNANAITLDAGMITFNGNVTFKGPVTGTKATFTDLKCNTLQSKPIGNYKTN